MNLVLQNPSNTQNYNRYSYCLNNPLKYVDPSGYNYSNIDWGYSYGTGSGSQRNWKQELDWIYGRGEYSLGGGFGGLGKFYYVNGRGYQIASDGSLITGNEKDQGTRAFYRNNQYGFYAQTSGTAYYATENGRTTGFATSDVRCVWVNAGEQMPAWNDRGWRFYGMPEDPSFDEGSDFDNWWSNTGTALSLTAQWMFYGNQNRTFKNDRVSNSLKNSRIVGEARDFWYNKVNLGYPTTVGVTNFRGENRTGGGNFGFTGLILAGFDPIEQFVGSTHNFAIASDGSNLTYTITNVTSFKSLMYGLTPEWLNFYNTKQTYIFTEPINFNRIHK